MQIKDFLRNNYHLGRKILFAGIGKNLRRELHSYKDIHQGKTAVIIGNGPSVNLNDFGLFKDVVTFGCNRFYMCYKNTDFRPNYTVCIDPRTVSDFGEEIAKNCGNELFIANYQIAKKYKNAKYIYRHRTVPFVFSADISNFVSNGSSVIASAIQIAYYMGIKDIYIYGIDHSFSYQNVKSLSLRAEAIGDQNHFIENYRDGKKWLAPREDEIEESLGLCYQWLKNNGGSLYNISRETKLEVIPKRNIGEIFKSE